MALETQGDHAWARRAQGDLESARSALLTAIGAYRDALAHAPDRLDLRIKLLRSLFVLAEYVTPRERDRKPLFDEGREVFEDGLDRLAEEVGRNLRKIDGEELARLFAKDEDVGPFYLWGAVHWGLWGDSFGRFASIGRGVARRIRDYGQAAAALVPEYEGAGPYRLLGRLHALAPRVPFLTGWVRRSRAIDYLEQAHRLAPEEPLNSLFLAEAYLDIRRDEAAARALVNTALARGPRPGRELEDGWTLARLGELRERLGR